MRTRSLGERNALQRAMSATTLFPPQSSFRGTRETNPRPNVHERQIAMRTTLRADKRRIFDALTLPEYRETWLCLPCSHSNCRTTASQTGSHFRFDHYVAGALDLSITGCYQACRRSKMSFTWHRTEARSQARTFVGIHCADSPLWRVCQHCPLLDSLGILLHG